MANSQIVSTWSQLDRKNIPYIAPLLAVSPLHYLAVAGDYRGLVPEGVRRDVGSYKLLKQAGALRATKALCYGSYNCLWTEACRMLYYEDTKLRSVGHGGSFTYG